MANEPTPLLQTIVQASRVGSTASEAGGWIAARLIEAGITRA